MWNEGKLNPETFLTVLGKIWQSCEGNGEWGGEVADIIAENMSEFTVSGTNRIPAMMKPRELKALCALPEMVRIYRGCNPINKEGCCWTLDRSKAEWFARRFSGEGRPALLLSAMVERDFIAAATNPSLCQ
jgi:hypothetical protein